MEGGSSTSVSDFVNLVVGNSWPPSQGVVTRKDDVNISPFDDIMGMDILQSMFKLSSTTSYTLSEVSVLNVSRRLAQARPSAGSKDDPLSVKDLARELVNMAPSDKWLLRHFQTSDFDGTWVSIFCGVYQSLYLYRTETVEKYLLLNSSQLSDEVLPEAKVMVLLLRWQHLQNFQRLVTKKYDLESFPPVPYKKIRNIRILSDRKFLLENLITSMQQTATQMNIWARDNTLSEFKISQVDPIEVEKLDGRDIPLLKGFLANIFLKKQYVPENKAYGLEPGIYGLDEDKWLWKYLHSLDERSNLLGMWSPVICALWQGLFLSDQSNHSLSEVIQASSAESQKRKDGSLTILLFRSIHLWNFESKWKETWETVLRLESSKRQNTGRAGPVGMDPSALGIGKGFFWRSTTGLPGMEEAREEAIQDTHRPKYHYEMVIDHCYLWDSLERKLQESIMVTQDFVKSRLKERSDLRSLHREHVHTREPDEANIFLGSSILPDGIKVEELLDLKLVHTLGGLICTIIGGDLSNNEDNGFTSWCIVRYNPTGLYFHMDVKEDEYKNKQRLLDETKVVDYKGMVEISTMDGQTTVKSVKLDGSCYDGELEDFADKRREKKLSHSCAEKALHILPQSCFLQKFNLKCSVLHMFALAYTAGNKDYLKLIWRGNAGHVEYVEDSGGLKYGSLGQSQGTGNCALQKCSVLYTHEGRLIGEDIIWEGDCVQRGEKSQDQNGEGLKVCENKTETTTGERKKVQIIIKHYTSYVQRGVIQDSVIMGEDEISARLIAAREEAENALLVPAEIASAFGNLKQNSGLGVGAAGFKFDGHHEYRPPKASDGIEKFLQGPTVTQHLKTTVVVPPDLYQCIVDDLQARLTNGTIAEHPREFFVVKTRGSCSLQVFLCNPQDVTQGFNWLTDIVVSDENAVEKIFKNMLKGETLKISRTNSEIMIDLGNPAGKLFSRLIEPVQKIFRTQHELPVVTKETMVHAFEIQSFPHSNDEWKHIVGDQRKYNKGNYYLKATECQAIACSGTFFTTGGALVRSMKQRRSFCQPSTSSSSGAAQASVEWLFHGSCEKVRASGFRVEVEKVTATGKFSTFKGINNWPDVYWG